MPKKKIDSFKVEARSRWPMLTEDDFDAIKTSVSELATRIQARYSISADEAKKQADAFIDDISGAAADAYDNAVEALDRAAHRVDRVVKDNAWATVGSALLLGGVIGFLLGSERRSSYW